MSSREQRHATCVALDGRGVLILGRSGSGKSDLALRLLMQGAALVADDRVDLRFEGGAVVASPPPSLAGLIEIRGVGIVAAADIRAVAAAECVICLVVELVAPEHVPRLPPQARCDLLGVSLPVLRLAPFESSAADKLRAATHLAAGDKPARSG
ncbi:MAG: HPr kinase/phosphatase C-terminal domain-containing protein [Acetobacterales bacterium]